MLTRCTCERRNGIHDWYCPIEVEKRRQAHERRTAAINRNLIEQLAQVEEEDREPSHAEDQS